MSRDALQALFRAGMFITMTAILLLLVQRPGTAEFVVTVMSICVGGLLMLLVAWVARQG